MFDDEATPLPNLSVQQLEYLLAAANHPTRAAAAEQLGVTPSALTQGLTELAVSYTHLTLPTSDLV